MVFPNRFCNDKLMEVISCKSQLEYSIVVLAAQEKFTLKPNKPNAKYIVQMLCLSYNTFQKHRSYSVHRSRHNILKWRAKTDYKYNMER